MRTMGPSKIGTGRVGRFCLAAGVVLPAVLAAGCAPNASRPPAARGAAPRRSVQPGRVSVAAPRQTSGIASAAIAEDECAARLHDLGGLLLLYFATNHRLPERLED